jgi:flagellar basal-body rod protein FlgB
MTTQSISLFKAIGAKMDYLNQRQRIIAQNIANADTPGYRPQDLTAVSFGKMLDGVSSGSKGVTMVSTNSSHMGAPGQTASANTEKQKKTYEVAPAGNAVVMEEQMMNSNHTTMDYNLMTTLYQKNIRLIQTAIGVGG